MSTPDPHDPTPAAPRPAQAPRVEGARMKVGELARKTGKTVRALRLYEEMGLLRPRRSTVAFGSTAPTRSPGSTGSPSCRTWVLARADRGLMETVESSSTAPEAMQSLREMFRARLAVTRSQVEKLLQLERDLAESLAYLEGCRACTHERRCRWLCDMRLGARRYPDAPRWWPASTATARPPRSRPDATPSCRSAGTKRESDDGEDSDLSRLRGDLPGGPAGGRGDAALLHRGVRQRGQPQPRVRLGGRGGGRERPRRDRRR